MTHSTALRRATHKRPHRALHGMPIKHLYGKSIKKPIKRIYRSSLNHPVQSIGIVTLGVSLLSGLYLWMRLKR